MPEPEYTEVHPICPICWALIPFHPENKHFQLHLEWHALYNLGTLGEPAVEV